jgi:hypothetical protein
VAVRAGEGVRASASKESRTLKHLLSWKIKLVQIKNKINEDKTVLQHCCEFAKPNDRCGLLGLSTQNLSRKVGSKGFGDPVRRFSKTPVPKRRLTQRPYNPIGLRQYRSAGEPNSLLTSDRLESIESAYGCPVLRKFLLMGVPARGLNVMVPHLAPGQPPKFLARRTTMIYTHMLNQVG